LSNILDWRDSARQDISKEKVPESDLDKSGNKNHENRLCKFTSRCLVPATEAGLETEN